MKVLLSLVLATTACAQHPPNPPTYVRCQSPENCLQLNIPDGFNSPFCKPMKRGPQLLVCRSSPPSPH